VQAPAWADVVEVGPRDGLQNEPTELPTGDKVRLIDALVHAGVRRLEATSFVSPAAIPQLADAEEVLAALPADGVVYGGLVPNQRGYERARSAGAREVVLVAAASEAYCRANLRRSVDEVLDSFAPIAAQGRAEGIRVRANISTVFGDPFEGPVDRGQALRVVRRVVESGIDDVTLSDTIGAANPRQVLEVFTAVRDAHPDTTFAAHFHDTRGLALANAVAALDAGIVTFDAAIGGLGGSPNAPGAGGNVATEDLVHLFTEMGIQTGIDLDRLLEASELLEGLIGHPLPAKLNRPLLALPGAVASG